MDLLGSVVDVGVGELRLQFGYFGFGSLQRLLELLNRLSQVGCALAVGCTRPPFARSHVRGLGRQAGVRPGDLARIGRGEDGFGYSVEPSGPAVAYVDDRVGDIADQVTVMGDQQHRARVGGEGVLQHVAAREVEVIGRFVKYEQVDRLDHRASQGESGALATRQVVHHPVGGITGKSEAAEHGPHVALPRVDPAGERCDHCLVQIEFVGLVLMELGDRDVVAEFSAALAGLEFTEDQLEQRGFSGAVRTDECDGLAPLDDERRVPTRSGCRHSRPLHR